MTHRRRVSSLMSVGTNSPFVNILPMGSLHGSPNQSPYMNNNIDKFPDLEDFDLKQNGVALSAPMRNGYISSDGDNTTINTRNGKSVPERRGKGTKRG
eukprot:CAMPEP_0114668908 /NCGR_PEP_ID=MMETSP0191-20121206/37133_1 /TAXON_ID=126664 /ORGANISM="Sorites sp." /LENGTH=97 /DNA_ID=CAMNT_0001923231 /DNA_START=592 /DNA_END=882 /DNA_ORIENTATION=+